jgi:hypothetical protein
MPRPAKKMTVAVKKKQRAQMRAKKAQVKETIKRPRVMVYREPIEVAVPDFTKRSLLILPQGVVERMSANIPSYNIGGAFRSKQSSRIPADLTVFDASTYLFHAGNTVPEVMQKLHGDIRSRKQNEYVGCPTHPSTYLKFRAIMLLNEKVKRAFAALARRWIRAKKMRQGNDDDLLTGEPPKNPIVLEDFKGRWQYTFEPSTISRDIISRLTLSIPNTVYPSPKLPRNPYTNQDMTEGQFYSVLQQLRACGKSHWAMEAMYSLQYDIARFASEMYMKLRSTIITNLFANPTNTAVNDILLHFIRDEYEHHKIYCDYLFYEWAIEHHHRSPHIQQWRALCYEMYRIALGKPDDSPEMKEIAKKSLPLCKPPLSLMDKYDDSFPPTEPATPEPTPYVYAMISLNELLELETGFLDAIQIELDD